MASEPGHVFRVLSSLFPRMSGFDRTNDAQLLKGYSNCLWLIEIAKRDAKSISEIAASRSVFLSVDAANELCQWLISASFDSDYLSFFDLALPFIIAERAVFLSHFSERLQLYLLVKIAALAMPVRNTTARSIPAPHTGIPGHNYPRRCHCTR